jgi:PAS domain S-box-containing protein
MISPSNKPSLLIVDDKEDNLFVLEKILKPLDLTLYKATSGEEALTLALKEDLILILLDVQMPIMDGYEVLELMRLEKRLKKIPVIFITAYYTDDEHRLKSYELGAFDYLYKPLDERVLLSKVNVFLELDKQRRERQLYEQRYELILDSAGEGIFGLDLNGYINFANPAASLLLGTESEALIGQSLEMILPHDKNIETPYDWFKTEIYQASVAGYFHRVTNGIFIKKNGTPLAIDYVITSIRSANNDYLGVVIAFSDATLRLQNEETQNQLQQIQKMESIGQLTGGIAHDFNNLLMTIQGNLELLDYSTADNSQEKGRIKAALQAIERGSGLTKRLLAFARKQILFPKRVNIGECIMNTKSMLTPALGEAIEIITLIPDDLWLAWIDAGQFENAIVNLAVNARDAMPHGGKLCIEAHNIKIDEITAIDKYQVTPGEYIKISVTDEGEGMPPEIQDHIFEPFFTTKGVNQGTGLGLSMIYGFIKQSKGHITVYSEVNHGSTFNLYLPKAQENEHHTKVKTKKKVKKTVTKGNEIILLVEDESSVRELGAEYLAYLGYQVLTAENGPAALEILKQNEHIDLLFTDVIMPGGMTGPELATKARELYPQIKILFTSGYPKMALTNNGQLNHSEQHLPKPYRLEKLGLKIRELFD